MYKKIVSTKDMSTLEWLQIRQTLGIGGSEMAAVLGYSNYSSAIDVWMNKTTPITEVKEGNEFTYWGHVMEPILAKEFEKRTGKKVRKNNYILQSEAWPWLFADIDRELVGENVGLEIKTASQFLQKEWAGDNVPTQYYIQCQHYMAVTGWDSCWIAVLIGGNNFICKEIPRNEEDIKMIVEEGRKFWEMVENRTMPAVDGSEQCTKALNGLYKESNGEEMALPSEADDLIKKYFEAKKHIELWEMEKELYSNKIKELMKDAETGTIDGFKVIWKNVKGRTTFDSKRFKEDHPEMVAQYQKEGTGYRRFDIKEII